jgi:tetratricopeptide (TPR) repeat protein
MAHKPEPATHATITNPLAGLGEVEKRVLSYAASIGLEFGFSLLAAATEMVEEPLAESLERLVHKGILKELNWGDTYAFVQVVTLAQAYRDISSSRLRVIHKKVAEAYEKLHPDPTPDMIPEMGRQFHLGEVHDKSLLYNRYAARLAIGAFSPDVAIRHLERAREDLEALHGDHRLETADVLKEIGEQYSVMGDDARADEFYGESLKKLPQEEVTLRALLLLSRANAVREMDNLGLMRQYCEKAIQLLEKVGHKKGLAMAHRTLSRAAFKEGRAEEGKREIEITLGLLDPERDANEVARCYIELGNVLSSMPSSADQVKGIDCYRSAIQSLEALHDYKELARAHNNLATSMVESQPREALKELMVARGYAEKGKDRRFVGWVLFNTVEPHLALGEDKEAARNNDEARRIISKFSDPVAMQHIAFNDGVIAHYQRRYEDSERAYMESLRQAENIGYPMETVEVLIYLATNYADWGKKGEAIKTFARIREVGEDMIEPVVRTNYERLKKLLGI